jgi:hypothetical protein
MPARPLALPRPTPQTSNFDIRRRRASSGEQAARRPDTEMAFRTDAVAKVIDPRVGACVRR